MKHKPFGMRTELIGGLLLLILASSAITWAGSVVLSRKAFDHLVEQNDLDSAKSIASTLALFYQKQGSWKDVAQEIRSLKQAGALGFQEGMDRRRGMDHDALDDVPMMLLDTEGTLIYNGMKTVKGDQAGQLPRQYQAGKGEKITVSGTVVGYVLFRSMVFSVYNPKEETFVRSLSMALGAAVLMSLFFSFVLGLFLASRFARPLVRLESAVKAITIGDLESRVHVAGSNEVVSLSQSFNAMADRLQATEVARQNLIADVAHELRTPVSILQANLEMMIDGVYQADRARLSSLYEETQLLSKLIGDLRTISDLELGISTVTLETVHLERLLSEAMEKYRPLFEERGMTLGLEFHKPDLQVQGDTYRLMQVIRNILDNALKYAASGPGLIMKSSAGLPGPDGHPCIRISFADQGPGVAEADLDKIFQRFYRVERSRNRESGGRGLGLSICRQFIQASGGTMGASNRQPTGLEIWFELPESCGKCPGS